VRGSGGEGEGNAPPSGGEGEEPGIVGLATRFSRREEDEGEDVRDVDVG
jgi:hypothetical protein